MQPDGTRILVVEDEESLADSVRYNLEREGYSVSVASDGRRALERFRADQPSLVILDLMLPEVSGLDVCRTIRSGCAYGKGLRRTPSRTLKMAVLAPMARARVATVTDVNRGARASRRRMCFN